MYIGIQWIIILILLIVFALGRGKGEWGWFPLLVVAFFLFALFFATDPGITALRWLNESIAGLGQAQVANGG